MKILKLNSTSFAELLARIMKKALRKGSNTSDDDSQLGVNGDETDTEQHDSLPRDHESTLPITGSTRRKGSRPKKSIETPNLAGVPEGKTSLKNIVKMAAKKETNDEAIPTLKNSTQQVKNARMATVKKESTDRSKTSVANGVIKTKTQNSKRLPEDIDRDHQEKIVSERRRSILLRQQNIPHDPVPNHIARPTDEQLNYQVVNEKNQAKEQEVVLRSRRSASEEHADVFQYDQNEAVDFISDDDNTSYREDSLRRESNRISFEESDPPSTEVNYIKPPPDRRGSSPDYAEIIKRPIRVSNPIVEEASNQPVSAALLAKPKRRINSFLALVKEVVTTKKPENLIKDPEAVDETILEEDIADAALARSVSTKRRDSMSQSLRRKAKVNVKRQDSQTSVWSDNIPVITISKTASDECILEDNTTEMSKTNSKSSRQ